MQCANNNIVKLLLENKSNLYFHTKFPTQYNQGPDEENSFLKIIDNLSSKNKKVKENMIKLLLEEVKETKANIINSIKNNDIESFKKNILRLGTICMKDENKNNLLHKAIKLNNLEIAKFIWSIKPELMFKKIIIINLLGIY